MGKELPRYKVTAQYESIFKRDYASGLMATVKEIVKNVNKIKKKDAIEFGANRRTA